MPEQRVAASTLRRYSFGLRLAIAQADARPVKSYPSDGTPPATTMKLADGPSAWLSHSDLGKKESDGRNPAQSVAPHAHRGVIVTHETMQVTCLSPASLSTRSLDIVMPSVTKDSA